jgi:hypothetical protein
MVEQALFVQLGGFDEDPKQLLPDYDFMVRLAVTADALGLQETLALVRDHPDRSTGSWSRATASLGAAYCYDKLLATLTDGPQRRAARRQRGYHLANGGAEYLRTRRFITGLGLMLRAVLDRPKPADWLRSLLRGLQLRS